MGIASVLLLDSPHRLIAAVGLETAKEILKFSAEGVSAWGDSLDPCGVVYATKGQQEHAEVTLNMTALSELGIRASPWSPSHSDGLEAGWYQPDGGTVNLEQECRRMSRSIPIALGTRALAINDDGFDLSVQLSTGATVRCDMVVMTGGAQITPWAADKFHPVRHQALATEPVNPIAPSPMHIQYGYTSVRQQTDGSVVVSGCRWATPHLEVGETDDGVIQPAVHERQTAFLRHHFPDCADAKVVRQWSSIMTFSCDGLPVIGPLPGRPRIIACGGFGAYSPSLALRAAQAVTQGILTGASEGVPACFSTQRFE
jgi:glycine/D-amino acid oxidase-like deaminating enzyme